MKKQSHTERANKIMKGQSIEVLMQMAFQTLSNSISLIFPIEVKTEFGIVNDLINEFLIGKISDSKYLEFIGTQEAILSV